LQIFGNGMASLTVLAGVGIFRQRIPTGEDAVFDLSRDFYFGESDVSVEDCGLLPGAFP
jgi:hypothetical protein